MSALAAGDPVTFRNWATLDPPVRRKRQSRPPALQSDKLAAQRTRLMRQSAAQGYRCDACGQVASLLHPAILEDADVLVCISCRDSRA
jgi:hypothetical protein